MLNYQTYLWLSIAPFATIVALPTAIALLLMCFSGLILHFKCKCKCKCHTEDSSLMEIDTFHPTTSSYTTTTQNSVTVQNGSSDLTPPWPNHSDATEDTSLIDLESHVTTSSYSSTTLNSVTVQNGSNDLTAPDHNDATSLIPKSNSQDLKSHLPKSKNKTNTANPQRKQNCVDSYMNHKHCCEDYAANLEKTVIYRLVRHKVFGLQTDKKSGKDMLYGYIVSAPVIYYLFFFTIYLFSATSGIFWTRFLLKESHKCNPQDEDLECFDISSESPVTNCTNISDLHIVCYKFVFAFNEAFTSAAGVFTSCLILSTTIAFSTLMVSGGGKNREDWSTKCTEKARWCFAILLAIFIAIIASALYVVLILFLHKREVFPSMSGKSSRDITETINVTIVYTILLLACCLPWCCFQEKKKDEETTKKLQRQQLLFFFEHLENMV